jgi:hypothetical protein
VTAIITGSNARNSPPDCPLANNCASTSTGTSSRRLDLRVFDVEVAHDLHGRAGVVGTLVQETQIGAQVRGQLASGGRLGLERRNHYLLRTGADVLQRPGHDLVLGAEVVGDQTGTAQSGSLDNLSERRARVPAFGEQSDDGFEDLGLPIDRFYLHG